MSKEPGTIRIGDVVRASETDFRLVECFDASTNACTLTPNCRLKHLFDAALRGYFQALDGATLADLSAEFPGSDGHTAGAAVRGKRAVAVTMPAATQALRHAKVPARR